jgi:large subunit ribosomal protein L4
MRRQAFGMSLKARLEDQAVFAVESFENLPPKTKALSQLLARLKVSDGALLVVEKADPQLARISRNIPKVTVKPASDVTSLDLLTFPHVVVTKGALQKWEAILS